MLGETNQTVAGDQVWVLETNLDDVTGEVIGYLQLHETDLRAGHAWFSLYSGPAHRGSGLVMEGLMAFCEWVFANWPLRWIYAHSLEQNVHAFDSGIRRGHAVHLGTMHERVVIDGAPSDAVRAAPPRFAVWSACCPASSSAPSSVPCSPVRPTSWSPRR